MRPRKRVLLIDSNEFEASVTAFVLHTWGYAVLRAVSIPQARRVPNPDAVLAYFPIDAEKAQRVAGWRGVSLVFVCQKGEQAKAAGFCAVVQPSMFELLDRLRIACVRKRGPRKGYRVIDGVWVRPQPAEVEALL